jgi:hypothetical protein
MEIARSTRIEKVVILPTRQTSMVLPMLTVLGVIIMVGTERVSNISSGTRDRNLG